MLDGAGAAGPADIAIVCDENHLRGQIKRFQDMGVTDFNAAIMETEDGAYARTLEFLGSTTADTGIHLGRSSRAKIKGVKRFNLAH